MGPRPTPRPTSTLFEIVTADLVKALAFYRALGLDVPAGAEDQPHVDLPLPGGNRLALDTEATIASFTPDFAPPTGEGRLALAFGYDTPADVDAAHATLTAAGAPSEREPFDAFWGQRYATVRDPDGNPVDLFAALPTT
ncbi:VOC family protein [Pseudonocardia kujensis]|uniref:VOC family protein n=1 Tax=Pseudonocardia kujensis TaxID=1128675 RepID=UPI001E5B7686|nr:VOC family protein [Pseudonocardia kujensis]MCE0762188.1 VOC family protein [Pseudonocardia kujensis]